LRTGAVFAVELYSEEGFIGVHADTSPQRTLKLWAGGGREGVWKPISDADKVLPWNARESFILCAESQSYPAGLATAEPASVEVDWQGIVHGVENIEHCLPMAAWRPGGLLAVG
jgi:hypothetical protein